MKMTLEVDGKPIMTWFKDFPMFDDAYSWIREKIYIRVEGCDEAEKK